MTGLEPIEALLWFEWPNLNGSQRLKLEGLAREAYFKDRNEYPPVMCYKFCGVTYYQHPVYPADYTYRLRQLITEL